MRHAWPSTPLRSNGAIGCHSGEPGSYPGILFAAEPDQHLLDLDPAQWVKQPHLPARPGPVQWHLVELGICGERWPVAAAVDGAGDEPPALVNLRQS
jgi:hypothetical protein